MVANNEQTFGRFPLRRVLVAFFLCAAVAGGIGRWWSGEPAQATQSAAVSDYTVTATHGTYQTIQDADGDKWDCTGHPSADNCTIQASANPGAFEELGYRSEEVAEHYCQGGTVRTLYRRGQVAGYGCEKRGD